MCGVVAAAADAWIISRYNAAQGKGKVMGHAIMASVLGSLGGAMFWSQA